MGKPFAMSNFASYNPATGEKIWEGVAFDKAAIDQVILKCKKAFTSWALLPLEKREEQLKKFQQELEKEKKNLSLIISKETGKPLWDSLNEVRSMINKIDISIEAYRDRCKPLVKQLAHGLSQTRHKPHGVVAVFGPYNFPAHLPNGHLIPALLAGNTCLFKPSELTPMTAEATMKIWKESGLPDGVIELVQGGKETGQLLATHSEINGLFFTGSFNTGSILLKQFAATPGKILALELGGNNPLIVHEITDLKAASLITIQSAFLTTGQRCTAARRLILVKGKESDAFLEELMRTIQKIKVGPYTETPEPFMGPLINEEAAKKLISSQENFKKKGAIALIEMKRNGAFLTPGLVDVTPIQQREDEELFGPLLQLIFVKDFASALHVANQTAYGLTAGLLSDNKEHYNQFFNEIKAGIINWNTPLTGASSHLPFGGVGHSGNFRPSAYYAADYSAYPVASIEADQIAMPPQLPGL